MFAGEICCLSHWWWLHPCAQHVLTFPCVYVYHCLPCVLCMLLISQTMATYNEMSFRALCQLTPGMKDGSGAGQRHVLRKKGEVNVKGMIGRVHREFKMKKMLHVFNKWQGGLYAFVHFCGSLYRRNCQQDFSPTHHPASVNSDLRSEIGPDLVCLWDRAEQEESATAPCMHRPRRRSP